MKWGGAWNGRREAGRSGKEQDVLLREKDGKHNGSKCVCKASWFDFS